MTAFPFSSVLTSTGVSAGKSLNSIPASCICSDVSVSPATTDSTNASATSSFSAELSFPSAASASDKELTSSLEISPSAFKASRTSVASAAESFPSGDSKGVRRRKP